MEKREQEYQTEVLIEFSSQFGEPPPSVAAVTLEVSEGLSVIPCVPKKTVLYGL